MKIAIIGRSQLLFQTALKLLENGHEIPLIITAKEAPEYSITAKDFEDLAKKTGAHYLYTPRVNMEECRKAIENSGPVEIAVSINYTGVIPQDVIDLFQLGILNAHAGDLPRYRGNAPLAWAIINKEKKVGLCIHKMIGGELDSGNIIAKDYYEVKQSTRVGELFSWVESSIPELMIEAIQKITSDHAYQGEIQSTKIKDALRCYPRIPEDGRINWTNDAEDIIRLINASSEPFGGAYCDFKGEKLIIWRAELDNDEQKYLAMPGQVIPSVTEETINVVCGSGKIKVTEVEVNGIRTDKPKEILKSVRLRLR